jgi:hypothetical protein
MVEDYKNHLMVASEHYQSTAKYIPVTSVSWKDAQGRRALHILKSVSRYASEFDAINAALWKEEGSSSSC